MSVRLKTLRQISRIKPPASTAKRVIRKRVIDKGPRQLVRLSGGPFDGRNITLQAETYGTLAFRIGLFCGRYNKSNEWEPL